MTVKIASPQYKILASINTNRKVRGFLDTYWYTVMKVHKPKDYYYIATSVIKKKTKVLEQHGSRCKVAKGRGHYSHHNNK